MQIPEFTPAFQRACERMVERLAMQGIKSPAVLTAMRTVPRHFFVDEAMSSHAYVDSALPIGQSQTISQPYIVARMTEALLEQGTIDTVLEIGTGCGYQTAVLAHVIPHVYSVERIHSLLSKARQRLAALQINNVRFHYADGYAGLAEHAPYAGIIVTAAPDAIPPALLDQLEMNGNLVIPVGPQQHHQALLKITRNKQGYAQHSLDQVSFVPLRSGLR